MTVAKQGLNVPSQYPGKYVSDKTKIKPGPKQGDKTPGPLTGPAKGKMGKSK
jgi:hypothetical protein